ncbi:MAG: hypothetical protein AAFW75_09950 [Cyanobacteria bacterium J06636_16]
MQPSRARSAISATLFKGFESGLFERYLLDNPEAQGFLTQTYLDSLGVDPFQVAIVRKYNNQG